jgi:hypothetical protein
VPPRPPPPRPRPRPPPRPPSRPPRSHYRVRHTAVGMRVSLCNFAISVDASPLLELLNDSVDGRGQSNVASFGGEIIVLDCRRIPTLRSRRRSGFYIPRVVVGLRNFRRFPWLPTAFACELGVPIMFRASGTRFWRARTPWNLTAIATPSTSTIFFLLEGFNMLRRVLTR